MIVRKQSWFKRSLSLLLALAMCMGVLGMTAMAEETDDGSEIVNWAGLYGDKGTNSLAATCDSVNSVSRLTDGSYVAVGAFDGNGVTGVDGQKAKTDAAFLFYDQNGVMEADAGRREQRRLFL